MGKRKSKVAKVHYVDNAVFLEAMIEYKKQYHISKRMMRNYLLFQNIWDLYF